MKEIFHGPQVSRNGLHEIITVAEKCLKTQLRPPHTPTPFPLQYRQCPRPWIGPVPEAQRHLCLQDLGYPEGVMKHGLLFSG